MTENASGWLKIGNKYDNMRNFPHSLGAIDGKHILMQCPALVVRRFITTKIVYNTVVLIAVEDAN